MALAPGTRLGVYEITAPIGAGGMGEVYRARDLKLGRDVALKVLPDSVAHDPDRLARFRREAQVLASLNHPNIAAIYGVEDAGETHALVMELVEGEDLAEKIGLPLDETLAIARQIADALEAAHEQGIVHRDLKPANIKVRPDGTVKVLDFGLAKALDQTPASTPQVPHALSMSPTITSPALMTGMGVILGTAAYMSPEQAKGRPVDKRADVWAFGCVLFEMLTGKRAFEGEDVSETLARILMKEPDWTALPPTVPPAVVTVLRRCLQRDRKQRVRDIGDVSLALDGAFETVAPAPLSAAVAPRSVAARGLPWAVAAVLFVAVGVALWAPWRSEKPADRPLMRLDVDLGADAAFPSANGISGSSIAISPDGTRLAYTSGTPSKLFIRRLDQSKSTELPGTQGAIMPFFSRDGRWVGFSVSGTVSKVSVEGGAVVLLGQVASFAGATWAEDDSVVISEAFGRGLLRFPAGGGAPTVIASLSNGEAALAVPQLLPGGKAILLAAAASATGGAAAVNVEVLSLVDGRRRILARGSQSPYYVPSADGIGHLLYLNKATLFAVPFDLNTLETRGTPVPALDDVAYAATTGGGLFDVSRTGTMVYRKSRGDAGAAATVQWVSPSDGAISKKEPLRATPGAYQDPRVSPDGKRLALIIPEGANQDLWVYDPQRDAMTRLTFGGVNRYPAWSPDGQYILFAMPPLGISQTRADGAARPQALTGNKTVQFPWSFTPDGKRLAYYETVGPAQIWTVPLDDQGGQLKAGTPEQFLKSTFSEGAPSFSPDGRWIAYQSSESGRLETYVRAFPPPASGEGGKWQISNNGGLTPRWSRTGHELVYRIGNQLMTVSYTVNGNTFVADKPRVWIAALGGTDWDLAPDGKRVAVVIPEGAAQAPQQEHEIVMLQNFDEELRRRVPPGK